MNVSISFDSRYQRSLAIKKKKENDTYARYEDSLNPCRVLTTVAYHSSIERATKRDVREK